MPIEVVSPDDLTQVYVALNLSITEQANKNKIDNENLVTQITDLKSQLATIPQVKQPSKISDRIASINIGAKNYDDPAYQAAMAKASLVLMGFYIGWRGDKAGEKISAAVKAIKDINPKCKVGQYTNLMESTNPTANDANLFLSTKLNAENWWLRDALGNMVQWTKTYGTWDTNFTTWTKPDVNGDRLPQWLAKQRIDQLFSRVPFDICVCDNVFNQSRTKQANWKLDGKDTLSANADIAAAFRTGYSAYWNIFRNNGLEILGNVDSDLSSAEYKGQLNYALLEKMIGASWSLETLGWKGMFDRYIAASKNAKTAIFHAIGPLNDIEKMRYALASCLLGDGMFAYSDIAVEYSSTPWFDDYDLPLGYPIEPVPTQDFLGVWTRKYQNGVVSVDTKNKVGKITVG